jgi:hypothetical protein
MQQFYPMKATLEELFGRRCYRRLKETADLSDWKAETNRLLSAIQLSLDTTVEVVDEEWRLDVKRVIDLGRSHIKSCKSITDLFADLSAILTRLVFIQLGVLPPRRNIENVPLSPKYWRATRYRSVHYIQTRVQQGNVEQLLRRRKGIVSDENT